MTASDSRRRSRRAAVLKALGHPTRVLLVELLGRGERCVCELHEAAGGDFSTVSRHLGQLWRAGVVEREKRGAQVWYRLRGRWPLRMLEYAARIAERARREVAK
ncbi:MAG: metalloregulator ArsR/SmtB family transcription factor [Bryobacteraceae bacterium]|nr:metalloregulator ArsR/SmtB family transcription factor [Bryobacteraceae bacterium]